MLRPMIFVGCGGAGGMTLRVTRRMLEDRLRQVGWTGDLPAAWQFLHIDVPAAQEGAVGEFGPLLPPDCYLNLVERGVHYRHVDAALSRQVDDMPECTRELAGWRPDPAEVMAPIRHGAGQYRAVGRVIGLQAADRIVRKVRRAMGAATGAAARESLRGAAEALGATCGQAEPTPIVVLVSSLAGGTGAGILMDVADILRAECGPAGDQVLAMLYTSDVFSDISGPAPGMQGNTVAALAELMAGHWATDAWAMRVLHEKGVKATPLTRGGPAFPFLVGAANTSYTLRSHTEVYRAIGGALGTLASSAEVQERIVSFLLPQWSRASSTNTDALGLTPGGQPFGVVSSLGYARVGLGRGRFRDYSVKRLARDAAEHLAAGYLVAAQANWRDEQLTASEALRRIVELNAERFLGECNLEKRSITAAVRSDGVASGWDAVVARVLEDVSALPAAAAGTWLARIASSCQPLGLDHREQVEQAGVQAGLEWAEHVLDRVLEVTGRYIGRCGIPVAVGLVENAVQEMRTVGHDLLAEAAQMKAEGDNWMGRVDGLLPQGQDFQGHHPGLLVAAREVLSPLRYDGEARLRERASALVVELAEQVLTPLLSALRAAQQRLEADLDQGSGGGASDVSDWPRRDWVPSWLQPALVEVLLDGVDTYPATFTRLMTATWKRSAEAELWGPAESARLQLVTGGFETAVASVPRALRSAEGERWWRPLTVGGSGEPSRFVAEFGVDHLVERAEAWVDRPGPFRDHIDESLVDYLGTHDNEGIAIVDHPSRLATFRARLEVALAVSAPLIDIGPDNYRATHPYTPVSALTAEIVEPMPLPTGHPARNVAEEVLLARGIDQGRLGEYFTDGGVGVDSVGILSYVAVPSHPAAFRSVVEPIAAQARRGGAGFWQWRRTRPLQEAVPVPSEVRRAMIRGWFTARLLGMLDLGSREGPYRVLRPGEGWIEFPHPLLGPVPGDHGLEQVTAVLESVPLAFVEWGVGEHDAVHAYRQIFHLGLSDVRRPDELAYTTVGDDLGRWIATGTAPDGCSVISPIDRDDPGSRVAATAELLMDQAERCVQIANAPLAATSGLGAGTSGLGAGRGHELAGEIAEQLALLAAAVQSDGTGPMTL